MLRNYVKVALRGLARRIGYTFINVLGLAVGLTCVFLIGLFIRHELSYDRFHEHADRIYRVVEVYEEDGQLIEESVSNPFPVGPALEDAFDLTMVRLYPPYFITPLVSYQDRRFYENRFFFADSTAFEVFSFEMLRGNPATALDAPSTVILTESTAQRYFAGEDPLGKTLRFDGKFDLEVTGVVADPPANAHFQFDFLASLQPLETVVAASDFEGLNDEITDWFWNPAYTYVLLPEGMSGADMNAQIPGFIRTHAPEWARESITLYFQPLADIHLHSQLDNELAPNGSMRTVRLFTVIALFILLIACINFMNLSTARSMQRAKEVGMRKVLGAERPQLVAQFLGESIFVSLTATLLAAVATLALLPAFGQLLGAELPRGLWVSPLFFGAALGVALVVGLLAGLYPAFVLSAYEPIKTLKGAASTRSPSATRLRQGLVVTQFAISIALLVSTFVVYEQVQYLKNKELGFEKEQVVMIPIQGTSIKENPKTFKDELRRSSPVVAASAVSEPLGMNEIVMGFHFEGFDEMRPVRAIAADVDFTEVFGIEMIAGRSFDPRRTAEENNCMLNETLAQELGWGEQAVGKRLITERRAEIVGVMRDFHYASLREGVAPFAVCHLPEIFDFVAARVAPGSAGSVMASIETVWHQFVPERPFAGFFLDARLDQLYRTEQRLGGAFGVFAGLAIFVACLGLLGLAAFTAERRVKEIGVRKVLGASVSSIVFMLSSDFLKLVGVAFVVAAPLAYFGMRAWLADFVYRIDLGMGAFVLAGVLAVAVAWLTIGYQALRAATADPVKSLRYE